MRGWALTRLGRREEGLVELREAVPAYRATTSILSAYFALVLAQAEIESGQAQTADEALAIAEAALGSGSEGFWNAGLMRLRAELQLLRAPTDLATVERYYERSLKLARQFKTASLELQAAVGLASLRRRQGRAAEAHDLVAPVLANFTEGFDTADLQEATNLVVGAR